MRVETAIRLVDGLIYKPNWLITATDHTARFEDAICLRFDYPAFNSNRESIVNGEYVDDIPMTYASFPLMVGPLNDVQLYRAIAEAITEIEIHEMREFLRIKATNWAPFHPHRYDGIGRWIHTESAPKWMLGDLQFGIA